MKHQILDSGINLTNLGLGTAQLGNLYRETSDQEVTETVAAAWDGGIRYFDTAPHYGLGLAERRLGEALRKYPRNQFVVSTKVGRLLEPNPHYKGESDNEGFSVPANLIRHWDFSRDGILRSVDDSLRRTGLDKFDILYLHDPENHFDQASNEGITTLIELREQGVVSAVGAGMNYASPLAELIRRSDIDLVMCAGRFTLVDSEALDDLLPLAKERNVGVVAAGVFNSGLLSVERPGPGAKFNYAKAPASLIERAQKISEVCSKYRVTLPEAAIGYVSQHPAVVSVVVGARSKNQIQQNIKYSEVAIPQDLWSDLINLGLVKGF